MIPAGIQVLEDGTIIGKRGVPVRTHPDTRGYHYVRLYIEGRRQRRFVHPLVCEAFHGPKPFPEAQVRHLNGIKSDNRANNLKWGTSAENAADKKVHGTAWDVARGEQHCRAKLTDQQVLKIRERYAAGDILMRELAVMYGVGESRISTIVNRKGWTHI
jgi:hypothetical protein